MSRRMFEECDHAMDIVSFMSRIVRESNEYLVALMRDIGLEGVVPSHGDILMQLFMRESISMSDLASAIGRDPSTVTTLVRKLEDAGYVEKVPSKADKRRCEVRLTQKGEALESDMMQISNELIRALTQGISEDDMDVTYRTMTAMQRNLDSRTGDHEG